MVDIPRINFGDNADIGQNNRFWMGMSLKFRKYALN